ncbi:MAG: hypothetical protein RL698_550 [Pseudomonadota bacterium]|jgi:hypothetical protein
MLADLPPAMADRLLRRIAAAKPEEMQREAEEWFARRGRLWRGRGCASVRVVGPVAQLVRAAGS